ncbi:MAG: hypothetical protein M1827_003779 [Pycnora praestabilis]|nr:MAG: hypothetical protein M1827_003779 [Pycnora praestabilis]
MSRNTEDTLNPQDYLAQFDPKVDNIVYDDGSDISKTVIEKQKEAKDRTLEMKRAIKYREEKRAARYKAKERTWRHQEKSKKAIESKDNHPTSAPTIGRHNPMIDFNTDKRLA